MTTTELSPAKQQSPSTSGALVGGALVLLSSVVAIVFHHINMGGSFGYIPGFYRLANYVPIPVNSVAISTYTVSVAWALVGVLMMTLSRRRIALVATLGTVFGVLFLVSESIYHVARIRTPVPFIFPATEITGPVLITLAFAVCIPMAHSHAWRAQKRTSIIAMAIGFTCLSYPIIYWVIRSLILGGIMYRRLMNYGLPYLIPFLAALGWIILIASVKPAPTPAEAIPAPVVQP